MTECDLRVIQGKQYSCFKVSKSNGGFWTKWDQKLLIVEELEGIGFAEQLRYHSNGSLIFDQFKKSPQIRQIQHNDKTLKVIFRDNSECWLFWFDAPSEKVFQIGVSISQRIGKAKKNKITQQGFSSILKTRLQAENQKQKRQNNNQAKSQEYHVKVIQEKSLNYNSSSNSVDSIVQSLTQEKQKATILLNYYEVTAILSLLKLNAVKIHDEHKPKTDSFLSMSKVNAQCLIQQREAVQALKMLKQCLNQDLNLQVQCTNALK